MGGASRASQRRERGVGGASLLRERGVSTAREWRHCGVRGVSARRESGVIAVATLCLGRRVTGTEAWEGRGRGVIAASWEGVSSLRGLGGVGALSLSTHSVLSLPVSKYFFWLVMSLSTVSRRIVSL